MALADGAEIGGRKQPASECFLAHGCARGAQTGIQPVAAEHIEIGAIDMAWVDESIAGWPCTAACPLQPLQACRRA